MKKKRSDYRYLKIYRDRHNRERVYFRRCGRETRLPTPIGSPEFETAYAAALAGSIRVGDGKAKPGTIADFIKRYRESPQYLSCKPSTRRAYDIDLDEIGANWGGLPLAELTRKEWRRLMANRANDQKRANRLSKRMRALCEFAIDEGDIDINPIPARRPYKVETAGFRTWRESDIERFHAHWPRGSKERLAFDLLLYCGQRSGDTVAMRLAHIADGRISVAQEKTRTRLRVKLHDDLAASIWAAGFAGNLGADYIIETRDGAPRAVKGFYNWIKGAMLAAGLDRDLAPHGARKAAARRLAESGASASEIGAVTGHKSLQELQRYVAEAEQIILADRAISRLGKTGERTTNDEKVSNPSSETV